MSEQQEEVEVDLDALQESIDDVLTDEDKELDTDQESDDQNEENDEKIDLDQILDSFEPISLEGKISEDEAIEKAKERGWREDGKDKFGHQISAIEFLERTPLFHKIDLLRGDVEEIKKQNKKMAEQSKLIAKKSIEERQKMLDDFKAEKEKLLSEEVLDKDDINKLKDIDKKISETTVEELPDEQEEMVSRYEDAKEDFVKDNDWYGKNRAMTALADKVGTDYATEYLNKNGVLPEPEETFKYALDEVKKDFPDLGKPQRQTRVASRNNRTVATKHKTKRTLNDLPEEMRSVARLVMEQANLSEDEYMKDYES
jgi:hypothetical protein